MQADVQGDLGGGSGWAWRGLDGGGRLGARPPRGRGGGGGGGRARGDQASQWPMVWVVLAISRANRRRISLTVNGISLRSAAGTRVRSRAAMTVRMAWASMTRVV